MRNGTSLRMTARRMEDEREDEQVSIFELAVTEGMRGEELFGELARMRRLDKREARTWGWTRAWR